MAGKLTEEAIKNTYLQLLEEKPMDKITISEITKRIGINRQTFYYHYKDIIDLTADIFNDVSKYCAGTDGNLSNCLMRYYDYFTEHKAITQNIVRSGYFDQVHSRMEPDLRIMISNMIDDTAGMGQIGEATKELTSFYYAAILSTFIVRWIRNGMNTDRNLFRKLANVCEASMKGTIDVFRSDTTN